MNRNIQTHRGFLTAMSICGGIGLSITFLILLRQQYDGSIPIGMLIATVLVSFACGVAGAELMWIMYFKGASERIGGSKK